MIIMKKLDTADLIEDGCTLLYKPLIKQAGWKFGLDNPSPTWGIFKNSLNMKISSLVYCRESAYFGKKKGLTKY